MAPTCCVHGSQGCPPLCGGILNLAATIAGDDGGDSQPTTGHAAGALRDADNGEPEIRIEAEDAPRDVMSQHLETEAARLAFERANARLEDRQKFNAALRHVAMALVERFAPGNAELRSDAAFLLDTLLATL